MRFKIEHDGGGCYFVYRQHRWWRWWDLVGVETTASAAEERIRQASQYPKYVEV